MFLKEFILASSMMVSSSAFAVGPCDRQAISVTKAVIAATEGTATAKNAQYSVSASKVNANVQVISVQAYGLNGEDSDTAKVYEMVFRLSPISKACATLKTLKLTAEN